MKHRLKTVEELLRNEPPACSCKTCRMNCLIPCWGTPDQMRRIMDAGYADRLSPDVVLSDHAVWMLQPAAKGYEGKNAPLTAFEHADAGGCTFWDLDGQMLCALHDAGLKPLEGRMSHHHPMYSNADWIRGYIASKWDTDEGRQLVAEWREAQL